MNAGRALASALVALLAAPAAAVDLLYRVSARTEVRARSPLPGDTATGLTSDLELNPLGEVAFTWDTTTLGLQYAPTLIWREPQTGGRLLPLHRLRVALGKRWERVTLLATEDAAQGILDVGSLRAAPGAQPGVAPEVQTLGPVSYLRSASLLALDARPTDRVSLQLQGGYVVSGSPTPSDQSLPLQHGPVGNGSLRFRGTRVDTLLLSAQTLQATFATGEEQLLVSGTAGWERQLTRPLTLSLAAGAAFTRQRVVASATSLPGVFLGALPVAVATLGWRERLLAMPLSVQASLRLSPFADRFTGAVYERLEARLAGEWRPERDWTVTAAGGFAQSVPVGRNAQAGDSLVYGEGTASWALERWLLLGLSARVLFTQSPRLAQQGLAQGVATVFVTVLEQDATAW